MRFISLPTRFFALPLLALSCSAAPAPSAGIDPASPPASAALTPAAHRPVPHTQRIQVEDNSALITEVRVGGATQSITVQPKSALPAYQVAPDSGQRSWKVLGF